MWLPLMCKQSGTIDLAQPGLTTGCQAGRQTGAGKSYSSTNAFNLLFSAKACCKVVYRSTKCLEAIIFLLSLSTVVLNSRDR